MSEDVKLTVLDGVVDPDVTPVKEDEVKYLEKFVGDGKKYNSNEDLAKGYENADTFIQTLQEEKREVERQLTLAVQDKKTTADIMAEITKAAAPPAADPDPLVVDPNSPKPLSQEDIEALLESKLTANEAASKAKDLRTEIQGNLIEALGDKRNLAIAIKSYAGDDKTRLEFLDQMVLVDFPNAVEVLKKAAGDKISFGDGIVRKTTPSEIPSGLTWSKCQKIRADNPKMYKSVEFQNEIHREAARNPNFMTT